MIFDLTYIKLSDLLQFMQIPKTLSRQYVVVYVTKHVPKTSRLRYAILLIIYMFSSRKRQLVMLSSFTFKKLATGYSTFAQSFEIHLLIAITSTCFSIFVKCSASTLMLLKVRVLHIWSGSAVMSSFGGLYELLSCWSMGSILVQMIIWSYTKH
jgi:hypothetical protein